MEQIYGIMAMNITCNICKGKEFNFFCDAADYISGENFSVFRCKNCGMGITCPRPQEEKLKQFYPQGYYDEKKIKFNVFTRQFIKFHEWSKIRLIRRYYHGQPGRMLDIGCGRGRQLKYFKDRGWETWGTELSQTSAVFARNQLKLDICVGQLDHCGFKEDFFDVVSLWHVLEHLPDPEGALRQIERITKKGGLLFVSLPNFSSWQSRLAKNLWFHTDVPRHLYHFTPRALEKLLTAANFKIFYRSFSSMGYGYFGIIQSILNLTGCELNFLWDFVVQKSGKAKKTKKYKVFIGLLASICLLPFCIIPGLLIEAMAILFSAGAVITVAAVKIPKEGEKSAC